MGTVQYFLAVLLSAQLVLNSPMQPDRTYMEGSKRCTECPAGEFQKSCTQCKPCPHGTYTKEWNREPTCLKCFRDCSTRYHLKVVQNCTRTTPLRCVCEPGFRCTEIDHLGNCRDCEKEMDTTAALVTLSKDKQTSSAQTKRCSSPRCDAPPGPTTSNPKPAHTGTGLAAILGPVVFIGCVALMILFCIYQPREETCFRQSKLFIYIQDSFCGLC
ncbi:hypothetical protein CHARACLAT_014089 [Characodon lateralis]|uniref:TNFR-Cys domain-containing protein n=1 Tax=Characodon lateralis TaxID=208331 RepID=A0ABU7D108_9TELE|nr:hypothetical protein [Characodon lateralis]